MPFGGRSPAGAGEGVELARGYISLTAKYSPAMQQVAKDFRVLEDEAAATGKRAGQNISSGVRDSVAGTGGLTYHLRNALRESGRTFESDAAMYGTIAGRAISKGVAAPFVLAERGVKKFGQSAMETVTGPMAKMIGATTIIGGLFETFKKGLDIDSAIQQANRQLGVFGAKTQDVQDYWKTLNDTINGTSVSLNDANSVALDLFSQGKRGSALGDELKNILNIATALNKPVDSVMQLLEKGVGRGALNSMVLGSLGAQGIPMRQAVMAHLGLPDTPEGSNKLDDMLKKHPITGTEGIDILGHYQNIPGALGAQSNTAQGQLSRFMKGLGGIGAGLMAPVFGDATGPLGGLASWGDRMQQPAAQKTLGQIGGDIGKVGGDVGTIATSLIRTVSTAVMGSGAKGSIDAESIQHAFDNVQHAIENFIHALDNVNHAADNLHHAFENVWHAGDNVFHALENVWHAGENVWHALENIWHAADNVINFFNAIPQKFADALSSIPSAIGNMFSGIHLPSWLGGRATGAIVESHAKGAVIQPSVHPNGIVQWAEPSTGGEAYIPLGLSNRSRSVAIWKETGRRLRMFAGGGFMSAAVSGSGTNVGDTDTMNPDQSGQAGLNDDWLPWLLAPGVGAPGPGPGGGDANSKSAAGRPGWWLSLGEDAKKKIGLNGAGQGQGSKIFRDWIRDTFGGPWQGGKDNNPDDLIPINARANGGIFGVSSYDDGDITGGLGPNLVAPPTPGGMAAVSSLLKTLGAFGGGSRTPYQLGGFSAQGIDCSGLVSAVINSYLGQSPFSGRMSTGSEQGWLAARGFKEGIGPPGSVQVGWSGAHTDMSIGGQAIESTTSHGISGVRVGKDAASPLSGQFPNHMWLPNTSGAMPVDISSMGGKALGSGGGKGTDGGGGFFSGLMGIAKDAAKDNLPPGFIDYSQNPWVKSGKAGLDMLIGKDGMGGLLDSMTGGAMGHPLRPLLAAQNPAKAAALGWTQPGGRNSDRLNSPLGQRGELAMADGTAGRSGHGETFNYNIAAPNGVDTKGLNDMKKSHDASKSRQGTSVGGTSGAGRVGQPG